MPFSQRQQVPNGQRQQSQKRQASTSLVTWLYISHLNRFSVLVHLVKHMPKKRPWPPQTRLRVAVRVEGAQQDPQIHQPLPGEARVIRTPSEREEEKEREGKRRKEERRRAEAKRGCLRGHVQSPEGLANGRLRGGHSKGSEVL